MLKCPPSYLYIRMFVWMDGWMDGWMEDGWMDGWFYKVESAPRGLDVDLASSRSYSGESTGNTVVRLHLDLDLLG